MGQLDDGVEAAARAWWMRHSRLLPVVAAIAYQSVIVAFVSYLIWFWLLQRYPASGLAAFSFWTPLFGVLAGWLVLGENLTGNLGAAAVLIAGGIYLVNRRV